jgi:hypothetical protein
LISIHYAQVRMVAAPLRSLLNTRCQAVDDESIDIASLTLLLYLAVAVIDTWLRQATAARRHLFANQNRPSLCRRQRAMNVDRRTPRQRTR